RTVFRCWRARRTRLFRLPSDWVADGHGIQQSSLASSRSWPLTPRDAREFAHNDVLGEHSAGRRASSESDERKQTLCTLFVGCWLAAMGLFAMWAAVNLDYGVGAWLFIVVFTMTKIGAAFLLPLEAKDAR
ncbi:MAG: hypothetical protein AAF270_14685, partial [Pseudomonadota bacterium]